MTRRILLVSRFACVLAVLCGPAAPLTAQDALARASFDAEISVDMKQADVVDVFRLVAKVSGVPFVLEFATDPPLRVSLRAENMVLRGVLASLASSYDLSYEARDEGIAVRRRGQATPSESLRLGEWPPEPGVPVSLEFELRDGAGAVVSRPRIKVQLGLVGVVRMGLRGDTSVTGLDRERAILDREYVAGLELAVCPRSLGVDGLELLVEIITREVEDESGYVARHRTASLRAREGAQGLLVAETPDGHSLELVSWSRSGAAVP